jgi:rSAM/selenodomain-associated transferase 1
VTRRDAQIVILAKNPVPGRVKTRLIPAFTPEEAADLARSALLDTVHAAAGAAVRRLLLVLDGDPGDWLPGDLEVRPQRGGSLDRRIAVALMDAYLDLALPVLLIGMDTPQVTHADLDRAVDHLLRPGTDAVLGPAEDGGYWLIGVRRPRLRHVVGVPMSRTETGARQLEQLRAAGLRVRLLQTMRDVDDPADAHAVARAAPHTEFAATLAKHASSKEAA